jgi:hypothetical protein
VHAAAGSLPERGKEDAVSKRLPEPVREIVLQCVSVPRSKRPDSVDKIIAALKAWI